MTLLTGLKKGQQAQITAITGLDAGLQILFDDIGLAEGAVVSLVHRGAGRSGVLAVQVGEAVFAVRSMDAARIEVQPL